MLNKKLKNHTVKQILTMLNKHDYKFFFGEIFFTEKFYFFVFNMYFTDFRNEYLQHNKNVKNNKSCLNKDFHYGECVFCFYLNMDKKKITKKDFYYGNEFKEVLASYE